jgi:hypothetical protein
LRSQFLLRLRNAKQLGCACATLKRSSAAKEFSMAKAFPEVRVFPSGEDAKGINLREYVAAYALQGVITAHGPGITPEIAAKKAIEYTNALLQALYGEQNK